MCDERPDVDIIGRHLARLSTGMPPASVAPAGSTERHPKCIA